MPIKLIRACTLTVISSGLALAGVTLRGGLSLAKMNFDPDPPNGVDLEMHSGFNGGVMGDFPINPSTRFVLGGLYDSKGVEITDDTDPFSGPTTATLNFSYLTFPVLISLGNPMYVPNAKRFFFNFGVEPAFKTSAKFDAGGTSGSLSNETDFDLGLVLETGGEIPITLNGTQLVIGAGYTHGLISTIDEGAQDATNYAFKFYTGIRFNLKPMTPPVPDAGTTSAPKAPVTPAIPTTEPIPADNPDTLPAQSESPPNTQEKQ